MKEKRKEKRRERTVYIPHIGQRILKTTVAVFLCLLVYYLLGRSGADMPAEALITAIICMQPFVRGTRVSALNRMMGTLLGSVTGLVSLFLFYRIPHLSEHMLIVYAAMAVGVLVTLYAAVLVKHPELSALAAIIYICIVITFPDVTDPIKSTLWRVLGVFIGTAVAALVNLFRLPRRKNEGQVFFLDIKDLVPDRFTPVSGTALYLLNRLHTDGAQICLVSEHAPAFMTLQMSAAKLNRPLIVMDGAAVWDAARNEYVMTSPMSTDDLTTILERLEQTGLSAYLYTVHGSRTNIYHIGQMREEERELRDLMRHSPYRNYLDDAAFDPAQVVCVKILVREEDTARTEQQLYSTVHRGNLRSVTRKQGGVEGIDALYLYDRDATIGHTEEVLLKKWRETEPDLEPVRIHLKNGYRTEHDAVHLLQMVEQRYMPVSFRLKRKKKNTEADR
ncbi:MAG: FUSC family protein [Clostridia bacterium]|nr:FUSC family protein [Clostridia bacterium]